MLGEESLKKPEKFGIVSQLRDPPLLWDCQKHICLRWVLRQHLEQLLLLRCQQHPNRLHHNTSKTSQDSQVPQDNDCAQEELNMHDRTPVHLEENSPPSTLPRKENNSPTKTSETESLDNKDDNTPDKTCHTRRNVHKRKAANWLAEIKRNIPVHTTVRTRTRTKRASMDPRTVAKMSMGMTAWINGGNKN